MAADTQEATQSFEEAFALQDHMAGLHVDADPNAYPYTYFRPYGDSWRKARDDASNGSGSVTLKGMWIDGTPGTLTVGRDSATGAWRVQGRTPAGKGLAA